MRVLCLGDRFITSETLSSAAAEALGAGIEFRRIDSDWPDTPFTSQDGVREAAGDPRRVAEEIKDCEVLLTHLAPVSRRVLEAAPSLRVVGVTRGGPVNVDLAAATEHGVPVIYLPGRNLNAVAEFTIGVMIALPRNIVRSARALAAGTWDARYFRFDETGPELGSSVVGLVGAGAVGRRVGDMLRAFGARVLVHDPFADRADLVARGFEPAELPDLLATSDIVSVHARLTDDTRHMFDAGAFAAMKPGAYFVNTARGELVDQGALTDALRSGQLAGAATDVFDPEPPGADDPLLSLPNVVTTPHLAGASRQVAEQSATRVAGEVAAFLNSGGLDHCANPDWAAAAGAGR